MTLHVTRNKTTSIVIVTCHAGPDGARFRTEHAPLPMNALSKPEAQNLRRSGKRDVGLRSRNPPPPLLLAIGHIPKEMLHLNLCGGIGTHAMNIALQFKWRYKSRATKCCTWVKPGSVYMDRNRDLN